jgi:DNA-binding XRE family transcriptional regulator
MKKNDLTLKELRAILGLTQEQAAEVAGVNRKTLLRWENGGDISTRNVENAARAYQCSAQQIKEYLARSRAIAIAKDRRAKQNKKRLLE